jgi:hypothetical protein
MDSQSPTRLLLDLRDIQIPEAVSWWPLAPGWWLLSGLLLVLVAVIGYRLYQRGALRRAALREFGIIRFDYQRHGDKTRLALELDMLLRRVAQARLPSEGGAVLTGEAWLAYLDRHSRRAGFSLADGAVLTTAAYARQADYQPAGLLQISERWIRDNA